MTDQFDKYISDNNRLIKKDLMYTKLYCEENVYKLCEYIKENFKISDEYKEDFYALFITN